MHALMEFVERVAHAKEAANHSRYKVIRVGLSALVLGTGCLLIL
jgi:hypothetical protein